MKILDSLSFDSNKIVVDLNKVHYAFLYWRNQENNRMIESKPIIPSVNGTVMMEINTYAIPYNHEYPNETRIERARRLDILDVWTPVLIMQLGSNHSLKFEGKKAESLWAAWRSKQFNKKKNK